MSSPPVPADGREVLGPDDVSRALTRIAHEILEHNKGADGLVLLGIPPRGLPPAERLARRLADLDPDFDPHAHCGSLGITRHRHARPRAPLPRLGEPRLPA